MFAPLSSKYPLPFFLFRKIPVSKGVGLRSLPQRSAYYYSGELNGRNSTRISHPGSPTAFFEKKNLQLNHSSCASLENACASQLPVGLSI